MEVPEFIKGDPADLDAGEDGRGWGFALGGEDGEVVVDLGVEDAVQPDDADVAGQELEDGGHVGSDGSGVLFDIGNDAGARDAAFPLAGSSAVAGDGCEVVEDGGVGGGDVVTVGGVEDGDFGGGVFD